MVIKLTRNRAAVHAVLFSLLWALAGCGADTVVVGPKAVDAGTSDVDAGSDTDAGQPTLALQFYIEVAGGDALKGAVLHADLTLDKDKHTAPADAGFQVNVVVTGTDAPDGSEVVVTVDGGKTYKGVFAQGLVRIDKVTLPCTSNQSNITVSARTTFFTPRPVAIKKLRPAPASDNQDMMLSIGS